MRFILVVIVACLIAPAAALASGDAVVRDCTDNGRIDRHHSAADYRQALANLPTDVDEYTDCRDVIAAAARGSGARRGSNASHGSHAGGAGGSSQPPVDPDAAVTATPDEQRAISHATRNRAPVKLGGGSITPGAAGLSTDDVSNSLPRPLLIALLLLAALALGIAGALVAGRRGRGGFRSRGVSGH
jgi:hypothetical protein